MLVMHFLRGGKKRVFWYIFELVKRPIEPHECEEFVQQPEEEQKLSAERARGSSLVPRLQKSVTFMSMYPRRVREVFGIPVVSFRAM